MPSVFVSHSTQDKKFVTALTTALNERGILTWVDDKQIKVGQPIPRRISEGIASCDFFLIVISKAAIQSRWVENELNSAYFQAVRKRTDAILPVLLERVDLPSLLQPLRYADFTNSFDKGLHDLLRSLEVDKEEIPFLTRQERQAKIQHMLSTVNKHGDLPSETMFLVEDESYLALFEEKLSLNASRRVLINSLYALLFLADAWDGRRICRHASIRPLLSLYADANRVGDLEIQEKVISALTAIDSLSTYDFLVARLEEAQPEIVAAILGKWQDMHEWPDARIWIPRIIPILHNLITLPQDKCLYFDYERRESDFRYWVFRCLQGLRRKASRLYIEAFLASVTWPMETLVEAAMAHWCVTGSTKYIPLLRRAARQRHEFSNAKYFLQTISESEKKQPKKK
jgi:hypothetical protein